MFKSGQTNPYDDIVNKTTDENLTGENWELILNLCDKVQDEGEQGARNVVAAVLKRLAHRNPNVQLYALSLAESLSKNCGVVLHRELASRAFTQGLEKIITDRTTHEKVKRRALVLIAQWTSEFENDPTLGIMEECYKSLKAKNYKFEAPQEPPPPTVDDEIRRKEEEELQRVLEMSVQDKGGRGQWSGYSVASSSGAGASGSSSSLGRNTTASATQPGPSSRAQGSFAPPTYSSGYVPARTPSPKIQSPTIPNATATVTPIPPSSTPGHLVSAVNTTAQSQESIESIPVVTRVRALHTFEPTEPGELAFDKGDVIKVVDRGYKDWWRGQLKGRTGIFPVNYVEALPEPTAAELAKEAEQEAAVFAQAMNVDKLLTMLRALDPAKDNLADNEEIQELYRSSMALRPKIVKLIDKYSQKRADLVSMNESFVKARTIFDRMMEDSLALHSGFYEQSRPSYRPQASSYQGRPDSRGAPPGGPQAFGWNPAAYDQPGYNAFPAPASAYPPGPERGYQGPPQPQSQPPPQGQHQQYSDPNAYAQQHQANYVQPYGPQPGAPSPYPNGQSQPQAVPQQISQQPPQQFSPPPQQLPQQAQPLQPAASQPQPHAQPQVQIQTHPQPQTQADPQQSSSPQPIQAQTQQQNGPVKQQSGPPYVYDPNGTYADPNVQAWAKYFAQGGKDPAGAVYFISVPGVTDRTTQHSPQEHAQPAQQPQPMQQPQPTQQPQPNQPQTTQQPQPAQQLQPAQQAQPKNQPEISIHSASPASALSSADSYLPYPGPSEPAGPINSSQPPGQAPYADVSAVAGPGGEGSLAYGGPESTSPRSSIGAQPPWALPLPQAQLATNAGSPDPSNQQQAPYSGSPTHSFHGVQSQPGQAGWHSQYSTVQNQLGSIDIGADGAAQHPGQQHGQQQPYHVGAST